MYAVNIIVSTIVTDIICCYIWERTILCCNNLCPIPLFAYVMKYVESNYLGQRYAYIMPKSPINEA